MSLRHRIEYWFVRLFMFIAQNIPLGVCVFAMNILMDTGFYVLKARRGVTLNNLKFALGREKSYREILAIARQVYRGFGYVFIEILRFTKMTPKYILNNTEINGKECIDEVLKHGKGAVIVSGHIGDMEYMGQVVRVLGYTTSFVVGEQRNKLVDDLFNNIRMQKGVGIIHRKFPLRHVIKLLRENGVLVLISDQDAGGGGLFVDFFGRKASTPQGAALFAVKTGAKLIFSVDFLPDKTNRKHRIFFEPIKIELTGDEDKDTFNYTQEFTRLLESYVRKYPEQYFWLHRRWKTRPPGEK